jgi:hypothetical protein
MLILALIILAAHNWARVLLAILGGVRLIFVWLALTNGLVNALVIILSLLLTVAFVTMFTPTANAWFAAGDQAVQQPASLPGNAAKTADDDQVDARLFCSNCGKQIATTSIFCRYCGIKVTPAPAPPTASPNPATPLEASPIDAGAIALVPPADEPPATSVPTLAAPALTAPLPAPQKTHTRRNVALALAGVLLIGIWAFAAFYLANRTPTTSENSPQAWLDGGGNDQMKTMGTDIIAVFTAGRANDTTTMGSRCASVHSEAQGLRSYGAVPDTEAQGYWSALLSDELQASSDCLTGLRANDSALIKRADSEFALGDSEFTKFKVRMEQLVNPAAREIPSSPAVEAWRAGGARSVLIGIARDLTEIDTAGNPYDALAMGHGCAALQGDVHAMQAYAPIPDTQAQTFFAAWLAQLAHAATDCVAATHNDNQPLLNQAAQDLRNGEDQSSKLNARLAQLHN